MMRER